MSERKICFFIFVMICYFMYSVQVWIATEDEADPNPEDLLKPPVTPYGDKPNKTQPKFTIKRKMPPTIKKESCSASEIFTKKPKPIANRCQNLQDLVNTLESHNNIVLGFGLTTLLLMLLLSAFLDVLNTKEEEKAKNLNPDGDRRKSLAEFANKKILRRESSKLGNQLCQIAETVVDSNEEEKGLYTRGDATNSYLSEQSAPGSIDEAASESKLVQNQLAAKLVGARPPPMMRRSSFPALPPNPDIKALMLNKRQPSFDSDDDCDGRGRRVRLIRRF